MEKYHKNIFSFLLFSCLITFSSCLDLDEESFTDIPEPEYEYRAGDATKILGAAYANFRGMYGLHNYFTFQICTDETVMPKNGSGWDDGGIYRRMHEHTWNTEQPQLNTWWQLHYRGAFYTNRTINEIGGDKVPLTANENKDRMVAEARALRAYHYWQLLDTFGDVPLQIEYSGDDDLPLPEKTSRADVYNFVVSELKEVIEGNKLSEEKNTATYGKFTQWSAKALLANIYLNAVVYTGTPEWSKCLKECNDIIASNKYQLDDDYKAPFKADNQNSKENILVIPFDNIYAGGFNYYKVSLHAANQDTYNSQDAPWGSGSYKGVPQFIDTYDADDERFDATWVHGPQMKADGVTPLVGRYEVTGKPLVFENKMPDGIDANEAEGYRWLKYEVVQGVKPNLDNDYVIFRLTQVLMMKAECLLRTGDADGAAAIVTQIRQRAFKNTPAKATVTGEQLTQASVYNYGTVKNYVLSPQTEKYPKEFGRFYDELGWEFAGESMRRRDMIRFGHYTKAEWLSHKASADYRIVFPIPQAAIDTNKKLVQNSSYAK